MIRMRIEGVAFDHQDNPVVVLKDIEGTRRLPIWIGFMEAQSIAMELEGRTPPRPLSHDLLRNILDLLNVSVQRVVINDLQDSTFFAVISLQTKRGIKEIDSRPSDALALAARTKAPIFVTGRAMDAMDALPQEDEEIEKFKKLVQDLEMKDEE
ncbi:MAG: bifunctional nuclease family protein [Abditibacteriales bacterium]|nr:bifunctional nuclease family protein [Abditibacteriales bacterium]MDW8365680.1 bifunctional nuclease family protein [Abditibacteriales bacterium]